MTYYCADVKKFHDKFGLETPTLFKFVPQDLHEFRVKFFHEEFNELKRDSDKNDLAGAIDALIDLVYITCGCGLLYGIQPSEFHHNASTLVSDSIYEINPNELNDTPLFMTKTEMEKLFDSLARSISNYEVAYSEKNADKVRSSLAEIYVNCLFGAAGMGFSEEMWNELWDDVQRANMSKVRAKKASESKRGSAWDVVKPEGWQGPKTEQILGKFLQSQG